MGSYVPGTDREQLEMLQTIGLSSLDDLYVDVPEELKLKNGLNLPAGKSEIEVRRSISELAGANKVYGTIFRGAGAYRHYIPSIVKSVVTKENLVTAYTPYQAEISQGILQSIFEYQTMICELTGMDVSNASVYDGGTAAAEAVAMCVDRKRKKAIVSAAIQPETLEVIRTYAFGSGTEIIVVPEKDGVTDEAALEELLDKEAACVLIQSPNYYGNIENAEALADKAHSAGAKFVMSVNPVSLGVLKTPAECGADVAVGDAQPLGLPVSSGGPYVGFMAARKDMMRKLPGRIVGQTVDANGKTAYVLTLQAREQHIRREKASSNICSNQALCALTVGVYLTSMGAQGLHDVAVQSASKAHYLAGKLGDAGLALVNKGVYFNEFVTESDKNSAKVLEALDAEGILGGLPLDERRILWCCTELNTREEMDKVAEIVKEVK